MKRLNLNKDAVYIIGVSGGPDSMALFDMCIKQGYHVIAAHMNYQKRESADRDMMIVEDYCQRNGIVCKVRMQNKECTGNFQAFAREMRYAFYKELSEIYHAQGVLLAHQLDDHLETYLMQKNQHRYGHYFGIQEECDVMGCHIIRPLLDMTKQELEQYCETYDVPYGVDESNLSDHYTRNRIRHQIIDHMNMEDKQELKHEITQYNLQWRAICDEADAFLKSWDHTIHSLNMLDDIHLDQVLIHYIYQECTIHLQRHEIHSIRELLRHHAKQWTRDINTAYVIYNEYGKLCIDTKETVAFTYTYEQLEFVETPYFRIAHQGSRKEALTLKEDDFPITVRSFEVGDTISMRYGHKKVNRWFIDHKIPKKERRKWPVVVNAIGNIILVPEIGCDIEHFSNNPTCFVLK